MAEVDRSKGIDRMLREEEQRMAREAKVRLSSLRLMCVVRKLTRPTHADLAARCDQAARPRDAQTDLSLLAGPGSSGKSTILVRFFGFSCGSPPH